MTHPTIKALASDLVEWNAQLEQDGYIHLDEHDDREMIERIREALRTLIDLHQDVEGDMRKDVTLIENTTAEAIIVCKSASNEEAKNANYYKEVIVGAALRFRVIEEAINRIAKGRADTHINELTRRISDEI